MRFVPLRFEPVAPEASPGQEALSEEGEALPSAAALLTPVEREILREAWQALRRQKPELYLVLNARRKEWNLRKEDSNYNHEVSRGFYVRLAKRLGITPQTVCYRLKAGMEWLASWLKQYGKPQET